MKSPKYKISGNDSTGYAITDRRGGIVYDLVETSDQANKILVILNRGIGPEWDAVSKELEKTK